MPWHIYHHIESYDRRLITQHVNNDFKIISAVPVQMHYQCTMPQQLPCLQIHKLIDARAKVIYIWGFNWQKMFTTTPLTPKLILSGTMENVSRSDTISKAWHTITNPHLHAQIFGLWIEIVANSYPILSKKSANLQNCSPFWIQCTNQRLCPVSSRISISQRCMWQWCHLHGFRCDSAKRTALSPIMAGHWHTVFSGVCLLVWCINLNRKKRSNEPGCCNQAVYSICDLDTCPINKFMLQRCNIGGDVDYFANRQNNRKNEMAAVLLKTSIRQPSILHTNCAHVIVDIKPCHYNRFSSKSHRQSVRGGILPRLSHWVNSSGAPERVFCSLIGYEIIVFVFMGPPLHCYVSLIWINRSPFQ